jgi:hypothetical protein
MATAIVYRITLTFACGQVQKKPRGASHVMIMPTTLDLTAETTVYPRVQRLQVVARIGATQLPFLDVVDLLLLAGVSRGILFVLDVLFDLILACLPRVTSAPARCGCGRRVWILHAMIKTGELLFCFKHLAVVPAWARLDSTNVQTQRV